MSTMPNKRLDQIFGPAREPRRLSFRGLGISIDVHRALMAAYKNAAPISRQSEIRTREWGLA
jgi:hypothetical protein